MRSRHHRVFTAVLRAPSNVAPLQDKNRTATSSYVGCAVCGKMFRSDDYLDQHFDRRHAHLLPADRGCVADQCGVLQCPSLDKRARPSDTVRQAQCFAVLRQCFGNADGSSSRAAVEAMGTCVEVLTRPHLTPLN